MGDKNLDFRNYHTALDVDLLLQASRCIDWRFLLPNPELGNIAYIGAGGTTLFDALRLFSNTVTCIKDGRSTHDDRQWAAPYDTIVLKEPSYQELTAGLKLLKAGGVVYVEACRRFWPFHRASRLASPADYITVLHRQSVTSIRVFWHWPNFEHCAEIVPLDDRKALLHALARRRNVGRTRLKVELGRLLVMLDCMARVVPHFSLVAQRATKSG